METGDIRRLLSAFLPRETMLSCTELKSGNINATYRLDCAGGSYILQRINTYVFREPQRMMENIVGVTDHLRAALLRLGENPERRVLRVIRTADGRLMHSDETGCWRMYPLIGSAFAYDTADIAAFAEVGRGFGRFQRLLADYPAEKLYESIPDFHNTRLRLEQLEAAVREDTAGRAKNVRPEIAFLLDRREKLCEIVRLIESGTLPLRVTHNDTKSNNVMLDAATGKALCVIDLDTVMPGSVLYDYGDAIRFGASTAAEDEPDTGKIALDLERVEAFTRGFTDEVNGFLSPGELRRLPLGVYVMTGELAARFLTDYLNGDAYFKIDSPDHNLIRTRAQIALLKDTEKKEAELQSMIDRMLGA